MTAAGMKISKTTHTGVTKNYAGGIEYNGSNLEAIYTSEGRVTPNASKQVLVCATNSIPPQESL